MFVIPELVSTLLSPWMLSERIREKRPVVAGLMKAGVFLGLALGLGICITAAALIHTQMTLLLFFGVFTLSLALGEVFLYLMGHAPLWIANLFISADALKDGDYSGEEDVLPVDALLIRPEGAWIMARQIENGEENRRVLGAVMRIGSAVGFLALLAVSVAIVVGALVTPAAPVSFLFVVEAIAVASSMSGVGLSLGGWLPYGAAKFGTWLAIKTKLIDPPPEKPNLVKRRPGESHPLHQKRRKTEALRRTKSLPNNLQELGETGDNPNLPANAIAKKQARFELGDAPHSGESSNESDNESENESKNESENESENESDNGSKLTATRMGF